MRQKTQQMLPAPTRHIVNSSLGNLRRSQRGIPLEDYESPAEARPGRPCAAAEAKPPPCDGTGLILPFDSELRLAATTSQWLACRVCLLVQVAATNLLGVLVDYQCVFWSSFLFCPSSVECLRCVCVFGVCGVHIQLTQKPAVFNFFHNRFLLSGSFWTRAASELDYDEAFKLTKCKYT
jgi:hypothetical protein